MSGSFTFKNSILIIILLIFSILPIRSQTQGINQNDLSKIQVDQLSDEQIAQILSKAQSSGLTQEQLIAAAKSRGMPDTEIDKLTTRINKLSSGNTNSDSQKFNNKTRSYRQLDEQKLNSKFYSTEKDTSVQELFSLFNKKKKTFRPEDKLFGFSIFYNKDFSFEPNLNIPTPKNYQLGVDDQINIDIWGASQMNYALKITPEGNISIPNIGPIFLNGLSIEEATIKIKKELGRIYSGLNGSSPNTFIKISLGAIRSIKVNMVGEISTPGTYTLPSLASVFNALYAAEGPSYNGTLRSVKVIRENKVIADLDFYDYLLNGIQENNIHLNDQDVIIINPYIKRVEIKGMVKRPAMYDLIAKESLKNLISYAGGFTSKAYTERIKITRYTGIQNKVMDIAFSLVDSFKMQNGDVVTIDSVLNRVENRVEIKGAILRPGTYSIDTILTIKQLINKAKGLRGDAFMSRASIYRTQENLTMEVISIDLNKILTDEKLDFPLLREDIILIPSIFDLKEEYFVNIEGEVNKPGKFFFVSNSTIEDLIIRAGGLLESSSYAKVEIARRIKNNMALNTSDQIAEIFQFQISPDLKLSNEASKFALQPFDQVFIRRSPGYEMQNNIRIDGEVAFPGHYSLSNKKDKISDIISRAGGLTSDAYVKGARLVRKIPIDKKQRLSTLKLIAAHSKEDSTKISNINDESTIGIELDKILKYPGSEYDLLLQKNDSIIIPKQLQTVQLTGSVIYPITVRYIKKTGLKNYISQAGGFTPDAKRSKAFVIYANGSIKRTHTYVFFRKFPRIEPGSEIIVPKKPERRGLSIGEIIGLTSGLGSLSSVILSIILLRK